MVETASDGAETFVLALRGQRQREPRDIFTAGDAVEFPCSRCLRGGKSEYILKSYEKGQGLWQDRFMGVNCLYTCITIWVD